MTVDALAVKSVTVKVALAVLSETAEGSLIVISGVRTALQSFKGELVLRGLGEATRKSSALKFVSTQPPAFLKSAVVALGAHGSRPRTRRSAANRSRNAASASSGA